MRAFLSILPFGDSGQLVGPRTCKAEGREYDGSRARHAFTCSVGGGLKPRSVAVERAWERIRQECGYQTKREVHVPAWDRFRWRCLGTRGSSLLRALHIADLAAAPYT